MSIKSIFVVFILIFVSKFSYSQETMEEIKTAGEKLFEEEKYLEATPFYLRLLAVEPRNHNYNYRYGTCLLYNTSKGQDVFKYLNYAVTSDVVEVEAYFFLGKAYHLNYQFNDAIKYYKLYETKAGTNAKPNLEVRRQIEMCENGKRLITTITEMIVIEKKEIEMDKFFRIYDLSDIGGNLLVSAEFQTKIDKKKAHVPLIHFPQNPTVIYYSSYGETGSTGKDIYVRRRLPSGGWGIPQAVQGGVNTNFDDDYPYMHPDGNYLYFSSKGHNSMGGFDVYRCKYDAETDQFGLAENMDFAVSSPDDDLFYVVDSLNKNAYFGSGRQSEEGKLFVYKVRVDRVPLNMSVIKGEFSSTINPAQKKVFIDVKDYASGEFIGHFNSNEKGVYLITFPKGGKYEFTIKVGDSPQEYKYIASIPFLKEFKPLKQKIIHAMDGDKENVKVIDLFNEQVEDPQAVFAQVLKLKAVLAPNITAEELANLDKEKKAKEVLTELGIANLSLVEVGYLLDEEVKDAKKVQNGTKEIENKINTQIIKNTTEIKRLDAAIKAKMDKVNLADTDKKKYKLLKEADRLLRTQEELKMMNTVSVKYVDSLSKISNTGSDAKTAEITKYAETFNALVKENKQKEAYAYLYENKESIKKILDEKTADPLQTMIDRGLVLDEEIKRLQPKDDQYELDIKRVDSEISSLEASKNSAKSKDIAGIDAAIKAKKNERAMIQEERTFNGVGLNDKIAERSAIRKQVDILEGIYAINADKIITKEELDAAINSANVTNTTVVRKQIGEEIATLVLKNPDVKEVNYADMEAELGSVVSNSRNQSDKINSDQTLTPEQKAAKLKALNKELLNSIAKEVAVTKNALKSNPNDPALKAKLDALQSAKSIVASAMDIPEGQEDVEVQNSNVATSPNPSTTSSETVVAQTPTELIESLNSSYNESVTQINGNNNLSATDKLNELQALDKELLTSVDKEIFLTENALKNKQTDQNLAKKLEGLKKVKAKVNIDISSRETAIAGNNSGNESTPLTTQEKETLVETVSASYNENIDKINANSSLSETEKLNQLQVEDKKLLTSIEGTLKTTEDQSKKNPTDAKLNDKIDDLRTIQTDLTNSISARDEAIKNSVNSTINTNTNTNTNTNSESLTPQEKTALAESINPTYNESVEKINANGSISSSEKLKQLQAEDKKLLTSVENEISKTEAELKKNPSDATLKEKLTDLKAIQSDLQSVIATRETAINSNSTPLTPQEKTTLAESINPTYNESVDKINANGSISSSEKLKQLQAEDKKLLTSVENEISKTEAELQKNPSDATLKEKLTDLKSIQADLQSTIATRESAINSNSTPLTLQEKETLVEAVNPAYNENVNKINNNTSLSGVEKLKQIQEADKELLSAVDVSILKTESEIRKNPTDVALKEKLSDLNQVKAELTSSISAREKEIGTAGISNSTNPLTAQEKTTLIESVNSSYNEKIDKINTNSTLSETDKLNQLQTLDKELLTSVESTLAKTDGDLKKSPTDVVLVEKVADLKTLQADVKSAINSRDAVISSVNTPLSQKAKNDIIDGLSPMYNVKVADIKKNSTLSETEKQAQLQKADKELLASLNKEITALENNVKNNPDPQLVKELADYKTLKNELESTISKRESANNNPNLSAKEKENLIETVNSSYNEKLAQINSNSTLSAGDKQKQIQELDKGLLTSIQSEQTKVESELNKKPTDQALIQKVANLNALESEIQTAINSRETALASNSGNNKAPVKGDEKANLIESVNSSYNEDVAKINNNSSLSENEKLNQIQSLDKALIVSVNKEITTTAEALKANPNDATLSKKEDKLEALKTELEANVTAREIVIASTHKPVDPVVKANVIKSIDSKYDKKVEAINTNAELSVSVKLEQLQELDHTIITEIKTEISSVEADLAKKTTDTALLKQLEDLKAVQADFENIVATRESVIASSSSTLDDKAKSELIESVSSSYDDKVLEIKNNEYMLDSEKQLEYQKIDKELVKTIEKEIATLETTIAENPSNSQAKRKLEGLKTVKVDVEKAISVRDRTLSPESSENNPLASHTDLIETLNKSYNEKVISINEDALQSHTDKLYQLQQLDESLQIVVNKEVTKAVNQAKRKPNDPALQKTKDDLLALKTALDIVVTERSDLILNSISASVTDQQKRTLISEVKPNHEDKMQDLKTSSIDPSAKIQELITEEKALIVKLEATEKVNQAALKKTPKDEDLKIKATVIMVAKEESLKRINELSQEAVTLKAHDIDQVALVSKVDPTFEADVKVLSQSTSPTKANDLSKREDVLQEKITAQIAANNEEIAATYSLELAAENQILTQKLKESQTREDKYKTGSTDTSPSNTIDSNDEKAAELREEILSNSATELNKKYINVDELKAQQEVLTKYSNELNSRLDKTNQALVVEKNEPTLLEQKELFQSEIKIAEAKISENKKEIETIESSNPESALTSPELKKLIARETEIKSELEKVDLAKKQRSTLEKELVTVQTEKSIVQNKLITDNLTQRQAENKTQTSELNKLAGSSEIAKVSVDLANSQNTRLTEESNALIAKAEKTKNPIDKNVLLKQAFVNQFEADKVIKKALEENKTREAINHIVNTLDSKEEMIAKKIDLEEKIVKLTTEIDQLDSEIALLKASKAIELVAKKSVLENERTLTKTELENMESQIAAVPKAPSTISETAIEQMVSSTEETQLIASKEYLEYKINADAAIRVEKHIEESEVSLAQKRQDAKDLIAKSIEKGSKVTSAEITQAVGEVKKVEDDISSSIVELEGKQKITNDLTAVDPAKGKKMQNLVKREVDPKFNKDLAIAEVTRQPAEGIVIEAKKSDGIEFVPISTPINTYSDANPIPVDVKNASGLVYRIQVGAFSKPIMQDMYKSFTPVSGEKLSNGITRYMAGYFNKSVIADEAHVQVKALGYSDAFIVAYCDDKRIPLAEAKNLEASGQCISTKSELFVIATSKMPSATMDSKEPNTTDVNYAKTPGAAPSSPVESHLGLFFTVQVGVYNKPATTKQIKNIDPLVTKRLPNGQIRYSTGMFSSIAAAKPKKAEARAKGVKDAYITAYYKGERITLSQANALLKKNGDAILEKFDLNSEVAATTPKETPKEVVVVTPKETPKDPIVSPAYNVGPDAVSATAVETRLGLFFTVQVGVYSKPASKKQLFYVTDLITKKLPNGQIRYSCGMFSSIAAAEPKRDEAIKKGVTQAYITAYYKGERITIYEANELLRLNGDSILEKLEK